MTKLNVLEHFVIYQEDETYNAFPSIVKLDDGTFYLGFRQAPDWSNVYPLKGNHNHVDAAAKEVYLTSADGRHWSPKAKTLYNHFHCGLQDICLNKLRDGTLLATFFMYKVLHKDDVPDKSTIRFYINNDYVHRLTGLFSIRSTDGGLTWDEPALFPHPGYAQHGSCLEMEDGSLVTAIYGLGGKDYPRNVIYILRSEDRGRTWADHGEIRTDTDYQLLEPNLYQTESGKLVCFIRTHNAKDDPTCPLFTTESYDGGKTWAELRRRSIATPNIYNLLRLKSGKVLLTYGYRFEPTGVRAALLDPECERIDEAETFIVRNDGGGYDVGYPSAVQLDDGRILIVYYFTDTDHGPWYIGGTLCEEA